MRKTALLEFGLVVTALVALGLVILSSASEANALRLHGDIYFFMKRQFAYLGVGLVLAALVAWFDYRNWREHPWLAFAFATVVFALLWVVFLFKPINGSYRWIALGPLRLQPSEFAKLATVILLAVIMDRLGCHVERFLKGALYPACVTAFMALPILLEPDFGSVVVVGAAGLLMMFVAGTRFLYVMLFFVGGLLAVGVRVAANANRMARIMAFFHGGGSDGAPGAVLDEAAKRASYQVEQALIAIKNGGIWGVGLSESMQKHYYLPEAHTDFIFAVGAEELGLPFTVGVLVLFLLFLCYSAYIASKASDRFGRYLVIGMAFILFFQAMFNIGVVSKALPTKGIALPFFSYGGTNMLSAFFAIGTILSVGIHSYRDVKRPMRHSRSFGHG